MILHGGNEGWCIHLSKYSYFPFFIEPDTYGISVVYAINWNNNKSWAQWEESQRADAVHHPNNLILPSSHQDRWHSAHREQQKPESEDNSRNFPAACTCSLMALTEYAPPWLTSSETGRQDTVASSWSSNTEENLRCTKWVDDHLLSSAQLVTFRNPFNLRSDKGWEVLVG